MLIQIENIGVASKTMIDKDEFNEHFWKFGCNGYSYYGTDGNFWYEGTSNKFGDTYEEGDVIEIWLDLRNDKNDSSFAKNDMKYGIAAVVTENIDYKYTNLD